MLPNTKLIWSVWVMSQKCRVCRTDILAAILQAMSRVAWLRVEREEIWLKCSDPVGGYERERAHS